MDLNEDATLEHSSAMRPCSGERLSGDATLTLTIDRGLFVAIVDVLGHGPEAHALTHTIEAYLGRYASTDVCTLMGGLHQHLRGTRGAAAGLCSIDAAAGRVDYAGIGNTVLRRFGGSETRLVSQEGVLGQNMRTPLHQSLQLEPDDLIVLYTDGVSDRFTSEDYPGLLRHAPKEVASNVVQRFGKQHDDAACIAVRYSG